ncbi:MAG: hypothetical protein GKR99_01545 [Rhodobacteraceae bacterium]|nr:hypothetical protein [Paracoccaceae bacterium]
MAWTKTAIKLFAAHAQTPLTRIAVPGAGTAMEADEPVTAIEMRTLFAGDLRSADRAMNISYG